MWALFTTLCIILVIAVYYKYKTRTREGFLTGVDWFGQTVQTVKEPGQTYNGTTYYDTLPAPSETGKEVFPISTTQYVKSSDIPAILQLYGASLATVSQLRSAIGGGFSRCAWGYLADDTGVTIKGFGGQYQEYIWCGGGELSANPKFDNGFLITTAITPTTEELGIIYAYGVKPPQNEPPRKTDSITTKIIGWNENISSWWNYNKKPSNYEVYLVYPIDGNHITIDFNYTEPHAIANAYKSTVATTGQARAEMSSGIMGNSIYPHWTIRGVLSRDNYISTARIVSENAVSGSGSASGTSSSSSSGSGSTQNTPKAKLELEKVTLSASSAPAEFGTNSTLTAPAVLLYGPKPAYEARDVKVGDRTFRAEFYNTVRNVWSKYEIAAYKGKTPPFIAETRSMTYGEYGRQYVNILEVYGDGSNDTTPIKITGAENANRTYPGCSATANACEKTEIPFYPKRPAPELNKYKLWKAQEITTKDNPDILEEQMYSSGINISEAKRSAAIRMANACRGAGGVVVLSSSERKSYEGCPEGSWCCSPDTDVPLMLPLSARDPAAATVGKTCEPAEEECDSSLGPAPMDTDAYSLSNRRRGGFISREVKDQFCKPKSGSVRTTVQERKSSKLLRRLLNEK
jgi:hypothetical protein